jgi:hypothetical protein
VRGEQTVQAVLVRVGIDITYGDWNAPVDPVTGKFVYVPIPEDEGKGIKPIRGDKYKITYQQFKVPCENVGKKIKPDLLSPDKLAHLDPDFEHLTYGDEGNKATRLGNLELGEGDLLVFYSALKPINDGRSCHLWYAIIGFYELDHMEHARDVPPERWKVNAHSRRVPQDDDIVFFGKEGSSGRLDKCICIGECRPDKANTYWTKRDLCPEWGEPNPIYIQRNCALPTLTDPERFYNWLNMEMKIRNIELKKRNNLE